MCVSLSFQTWRLRGDDDPFRWTVWRHGVYFTRNWAYCLVWGTMFFRGCYACCFGPLACKSFRCLALIGFAVVFTSLKDACHIALRTCVLDSRFLPVVCSRGDVCAACYRSPPLPVLLLFSSAVCCLRLKVRRLSVVGFREIRVISTFYLGSPHAHTSIFCCFS